MAGERLAAAGCPAGVYIRMAEAPYEMQMERGFRRGFPGAEVFLCPPNVLTYPPAREQVIAFPAGLPAGGGVFCRSRDIAAEFVVLQRDAAPGKPIRFIAADEPDCGTSPRADTQFDRLVIVSRGSDRADPGAPRSAQRGSPWETGGVKQNSCHCDRETQWVTAKAGTCGSIATVRLLSRRGSTPKPIWKFGGFSWATFPLVRPISYRDDYRTA